MPSISHATIESCRAPTRSMDRVEMIKYVTFPMLVLSNMLQLSRKAAVSLAELFFPIQFQNNLIN